MSAVLQWLALGALLAWSLCFLCRRYLPRAVDRLQAALARQVGKRGWPRLASMLQPAPPASGCDSGCGHCEGCAPTAAVPERQPVSVRAASRHGD